MKRVGNLYPKLISDENLRLAIFEVNRTHRWKRYPVPNETVLYIETHLYEAVHRLREIIENGYISTDLKTRIIYDKSANKERIICEPSIWPDQYIHHALIQVLEPVMMRGMDNWCCGSIKGRGIHYGYRGLKKWLNSDIKNTQYAAELDIYHFYESIKPEMVINRFKQLIKDFKVLSLIEIIISQGVKIGLYCSQWFANTLLQPIDNYIRQELKIAHYLRYMDNIIILGMGPFKLHKTIKLINNKLNQLGLKLKSNYQVFPTNKRLIAGLGYRFGHKIILLRKQNGLRLRRQLHIVRYKINNHLKLSFLQCSGLLSRIGQSIHCKRIVNKDKNTFYMLKQVITKIIKRRNISWNMCLENSMIVKTLK